MVQVPKMANLIEKNDLKHSSNSWKHKYITLMALQETHWIFALGCEIIDLSSARLTLPFTHRILTKFATLFLDPSVTLFKFITMFCRTNDIV